MLIPWPSSAQLPHIVPMSAASRAPALGLPGSVSCTSEGAEQNSYQSQAGINSAIRRVIQESNSQLIQLTMGWFFSPQNQGGRKHLLCWDLTF